MKLGFSHFKFSTTRWNGKNVRPTDEQMGAQISGQHQARRGRKQCHTAVNSALNPPTSLRSLAFSNCSC